MMVKQQLISEIESIDNPTTLSQLFEILQMVKQGIDSQLKPQNHILKFAGCLDDVDAQTMQAIIRQEFNRIEGEWWKIRLP